MAARAARTARSGRSAKPATPAKPKEKEVDSDELVKRREQFARYRIQRKKLEEERRRKRRKEMIRNIKLFFFVSGIIVSAIAAFVLFNGAWTIVDPILNRG